MVERWRAWARRLEGETYALYLACRDPRTPRIARLLIALVAVYAASPIDLIPDFVPVLGYLDDLVIVPLGLAVAVRLVPLPVLTECRAEAARRLSEARPRSLSGAALVVMVWILAAVAAALLARRIWS